MILPEEIAVLVESGAIFYCSHSGGKDSQAMYALLQGFIPDEQLVVVHADLGEVEWIGVQNHIVTITRHPVNVVRVVKQNGEVKTLLGMV
jgi:DNA sulfur modification protein DndC